MSHHLSNLQARLVSAGIISSIPSCEFRVKCVPANPVNIGNTILFVNSDRSQAFYKFSSDLCFCLNISQLAALSEGRVPGYVETARAVNIVAHAKWFFISTGNGFACLDSDGFVDHYLSPHTLLAASGDLLVLASNHTVELMQIRDGSAFTHLGTMSIPPGTTPRFSSPTELMITPEEIVLSGPLDERLPEEAYELILFPRSDDDGYITSCQLPMTGSCYVFLRQHLVANPKKDDDSGMVLIIDLDIDTEPTYRHWNLGSSAVTKYCPNRHYLWCLTEQSLWVLDLRSCEPKFKIDFETISKNFDFSLSPSTGRAALKRDSGDYVVQSFGEDWECRQLAKIETLRIHSGGNFHLL